MSTPSRMTIAWDRLDQMALLPQDSSVVIPPPITTIGWTPLLGPTIFDYDPSDFVITPGAGEEGGVTPTASGGGGGAGPGASAEPQAVPQGRPLRRHPHHRAGARAGGARDQGRRPEGEGAHGKPDQRGERGGRHRGGRTD